MVLLLHHNIASCFSKNYNIHTNKCKKHTHRTHRKISVPNITCMFSNGSICTFVRKERGMVRLRKVRRMMRDMSKVSTIGAMPEGKLGRGRSSHRAARSSTESWARRRLRSKSRVALCDVDRHRWGGRCKEHNI